MRSWRTTGDGFRIFKVFLFAFIFLSCAPGYPGESSLRPADVFHPTRTDISVSFKERVRNVQTGNEEPAAEYWASRNVIGLSFRVTYPFEAPITQMLMLFPDADPFMIRFILIPRKSLCYKNVFTRKDFPFDPHIISFQTYWHRLIDSLYQLAGTGRLSVLGEEEILGYACKKVSIGQVPEKGWVVWYSPKLDLLLRVETYKDRTITLRKELTDIREGRLPSGIFKLPPTCPVKNLSAKEFDALDVVKLSKK